MKPLIDILQMQTCLHVNVADQDEPIRHGWLYVAPGGRHLVVQSNRSWGFSDAEKVGHLRPAGDVLFASAAEVFGRRLVGIVLTGCLSDGADGVVAVKRLGGGTIAQNTDTAEFPSMPRAAIMTSSTDRVLTPAEIGPALERLVVAWAQETESRSLPPSLPPSLAP